MIKDKQIGYERYLDKVRGCMVGGAVGDALGNPIEFCSENEIFSKYGQNGLTEYVPDNVSGKALITDDTQMSLFTATGLLIGDTRGRLRGIRALPRTYVYHTYQGWYKTQMSSFEEYQRTSQEDENIRYSWLMDIPELFVRRAPGNTCLSALDTRKRGNESPEDFIQIKLNDSKGCGGIMRTAPLALRYRDVDIDKLDMEAAQIAAITHSHSLGYMPSAVLNHIINRLVYSEENMSLLDAIREAKNAVSELFAGDDHLNELESIIDLAIDLSDNTDSDLENINRIGEGWVAEETLGIALYCALRHQTDFSAGVIASVNHKGDSDSTGAVTGNILGALLGYDAIDGKWKKDLELIDVIMEVADDLCAGCQMEEYSSYTDDSWRRKYVHGHHQ